MVNYVQGGLLSTRQAYIDAILADAPPLSDEQRTEITNLFAAHAQAGDRK